MPLENDPAVLRFDASLFCVNLGHQSLPVVESNFYRFEKEGHDVF